MVKTKTKTAPVFLVGFEANCRGCKLVLQASSDRYEEYAAAVDAHEERVKHFMVERDVVSNTPIERSWFKRSFSKY